MSNIIQKAANESAKAPEGKKENLRQLVTRMYPAIQKAVPSQISAERFSRIVLSALSSTPQLMDCTPVSFCGAMMQAAQLGLEPNTSLGQAYLIPRYNRTKGVTECTFQIGYRGMIELAYRAGITSCAAHAVYSNDEFSFEYGEYPHLVHKPVLKDRGDVIAFYATWTNKDAHGFQVMSVEDVQKFEQRYSSTGGKNGPWHTNFIEMGKKTVIKQALKYARVSSDLGSQVEADGTTNYIQPEEALKGKNVVETHPEYSEDFVTIDDIAEESKGTPKEGAKETAKGGK